jgi:hypothetical protein
VTLICPIRVFSSIELSQWRSESCVDYLALFMAHTFVCARVYSRERPSLSCHVLVQDKIKKTITFTVEIKVYTKLFSLAAAAS